MRKSKAQNLTKRFWPASPKPEPLAKPKAPARIGNKTPLERLRALYGTGPPPGASGDAMIESVLSQISGDEEPSFSNAILDLAERTVESILAREDLEDAHVLVSLLNKNRARIKLCARKKCLKPFLAKRSNTQGCSPECRNVINASNSRRRKTEQAEEYKATRRYRDAQNKRKNTRKAKSPK